MKDFRRIRMEDLYYVGKTAYIRELERRANFIFFVRPRRFGKSLLCETLRCYYDVAEKENFEKLFGGLDIGRNPTGRQNGFFVISLDFSRVNVCRGDTWAEKFADYMDTQMDVFIEAHMEWLKGDAKVEAVRLRPGLSNAKYEAVAQLRRYAADPAVKALAGGTPVHFICYEFRGRELVRLEELADLAIG